MKKMAFQKADWFLQNPVPPVSKNAQVKDKDCSFSFSKGFNVTNIATRFKNES